MKRTQWILGGTILLLSRLALTQNSQAPTDLDISIEELRHAVGTWSVVTKFLREDGSVAQQAEGTYRFEWVIEDRVLSGKSEMPVLGMTNGILFYVNETKGVIEMVSVGKDGRLWVMSGPLGGDVRYSQKYEAQDGQMGQLRFTRLNVTADQFESKMAYTDDDGQSWKPANHQIFHRQS